MILLIFVSAFFSMSETIFSSVNPIRLKTYIENDKIGSKKALWITEHFNRTIATILVGNNLANIALATISVSFFASVFTTDTLISVMNTLVMTTIILIFGEIIPKSFGKHNAEKLSLILSGILYWLIYILSPITYFFIKLQNRLITPTDEVSVTNDELETIIDTMEEEGAIDEDEAEMLQSVLDLHERKVYEIMVPRVDMIGVDLEDDSVEDVKQTFFKYKFTRLPVFFDTPDNIVGVLHERDFLEKVVLGEEIDLKKLCTEPIYVSESMRVDTLIETLQRENSHLAIVSGEYGGTSGIVTMEDAVEELVGEIYDEHDEIQGEFIQQIKKDKFWINADVDLEDLFEYLKLGDPPETHYATLGGWLYDLFEDIPEVDEGYTYIHQMKNYHHEDDKPIIYTLRFIIKDVKERRISYVHLSLNKEETK
ncbi:MAG: hemolysin family protein [Candidatus Izimaplasma sp.]|nr:hemolysin family protein [Candidatus Izimaplasma bacterium]